MEKIKLVFRDAYKDGGTEEYTDNDGKHYYVDYRIGTKTKGKLFDKYPSDLTAKMLNEDNYVITNPFITKLLNQI